MPRLLDEPATGRCVGGRHAHYLVADLDVPSELEGVVARLEPDRSGWSLRRGAARAARGRTPAASSDRCDRDHNQENSEAHHPCWTVLDGE
jgi:hypothetical protein